MAIDCGLGLIKKGNEYYYTDCCGDFITGLNDTGSDIQVVFSYLSPSGGVTELNVASTTSCPSPTPTPTPTLTPTNTTTPTPTPTNTQTPTPSITPSVTPSNTPVTRLKNNCDVVTLFDMGISCNVIQNPSSSTSLDGIISVNVTGGTAPYLYFWEGGQRTQTLFGVPQGTYEVVVVDYYGDFTASTICSLVGPTPTQTPTMTPTPSSTPPIQCQEVCMVITDKNGVNLLGPLQFECDGTLNGQIRWVSNTTGKELYIIWNPVNNRWTVYQDSEGSLPFLLNGSAISTEIFQPIPTSGWQFYGGFADGNITVTIGSCPEYAPLSLNLLSNDNSCQGMKNCDGSITANAQGGLQPYYYSINGGVTTQTSPTFNGKCPGNYTITVYDSDGNVQSSSVTIGFNSQPITYQISVVEYGEPIIDEIQNVSSSLTQQYKILSNPPIPVGTSIEFSLTFSSTQTYQGPGNGTIENTFEIFKNDEQQEVTFVSNGNSVITRPNCSPNTQTGVTQTSNVVLTITNGDDVLINQTSILIFTNPEGSVQTNCTTTLLHDIDSNITEVSVVGGECSTAVGSSRNILEHSISYIPTVIPTPEVLVHDFYGSSTSIVGLCNSTTIVSNLYSYSSDGLLPDVGITLYQSIGPNNVLSSPIPPISSTVIYNFLGWNGGQKYRFQINGTPGVITTISPCP